MQLAHALLKGRRLPRLLLEFTFAAAQGGVWMTAQTTRPAGDEQSASGFTAPRSPNASGVLLPPSLRRPNRSATGLSASDQVNNGAGHIPIPSHPPLPSIQQLAIFLRGALQKAIDFGAV